MSKRLAAVAGVAAGALLGTASFAGAQVTPETDDNRATPMPGNATTCAQAGLEGTILTRGTDFQFTGGGPQDQFVTITSVSPGVEVTGIVVKGGPNYNVYVPGEAGTGGEVLPEDPPWEDLRSPFNQGGNIPTISNWFVCGTTGGPTNGPTTTVTTTVTDTTTETTTVTETQPGTTVTETQPGTTVTETQPGTTVTETQPGSTVTQTVTATDTVTETVTKSKGKDKCPDKGKHKSCDDDGAANAGIFNTGKDQQVPDDGANAGIFNLGTGAAGLLLLGTGSLLAAPRIRGRRR
ncbi:hypothetical protein [Saccharomonospora iraqiensis]|uniref:hypothetical protein n=1 Tax=Saccharomonospora iraqiensis TaxID=52698 RepID=UPI0002E001F7|nr:hypothetical protein [Saccharomonospora iraqiensis]